MKILVGMMVLACSVSSLAHAEKFVGRSYSILSSLRPTTGGEWTDKSGNRYRLDCGLTSCDVYLREDNDSSASIKTDQFNEDRFNEEHEDNSRSVRSDTVSTADPDAMEQLLGLIDKHKEFVNEYTDGGIAHEDERTPNPCRSLNLSDRTVTIKPGMGERPLVKFRWAPQVLRARYALYVRLTELVQTGTHGAPAQEILAELPEIKEYARANAMSNSDALTQVRDYMTANRPQQGVDFTCIDDSAYLKTWDTPIMFHGLVQP